jgi:hypothetical protein
LAITLSRPEQGWGATQVTIERRGGYRAASIVKDVQLRGNYACITGNAGLWLLDVGNATNIVLVASNANSARCLVISEDVICSGRDRDVSIHQIFNATNLLLRRINWGTDSTTWAVDSAGALFYACTSSGFFVGDASIPEASTAPLGTYPIRGNAVKVVGHYAYLATDSGLAVLNINQPTNITLAANIALGSCSDVDVAGERLYVTTTNGLQILATGNPTNLVSLSGYQATNYNSMVKVVGNVAYVAAGNALDILDISIPTNIVRIGRYDTKSKVYRVQIHEDRIVAANGTNGMEILEGNGQTAPVITLQPKSQSGLPGSNCFFYATVAGATPLGYQWYRDETNTLSAETNTCLNLLNFQPSLTGRYHLVVSNAYGVATSEVATASLRFVAELDDPNLVWKTYGTRTWKTETNITHDGVSCARGEISGKSMLETTVTGPGIVTFWWKLWGATRDYISFSISGSLQDELWHEYGWKQRRIEVPPGPQVLTWTFEPKSLYSKNMGFLDQVSFTPISNATVFANPQSKSARIGDPVTLQVISIGLEPLSYQWYAAGGQVVPGATNAIFSLTNFQPAQVGEYYAVTANALGAATSAVARLDPAYERGLQKMSMFTAGDYVHDVVINGNFACLAAASNGVVIVDISNPTNIVELGRYDTPGVACKIEVHNNLAYVADSAGGLQILDISIPTNITWVGGTTNSGTFTDLQVAGNLVYVSDSTAHKLLVMDVSAPTNTVQLAQYPIGSTLFGFQISGHIAYVATGAEGLRIYDISEPTNWVYAYPIAGVFSVFVTNNLAYTIVSGKLQILDFSNPLDPLLLGVTTGVNPANALVVSDSMAFVATISGLTVFDVRNPAGIQPVAFSPSPRMVERIQIANGLIFLAEGNAGLSVYRFVPIIGPPKVAASSAHFSLSGLPADQTLLLESSTNLSLWRPVLTNLITSPYLQHSEAVEPNAPARFFRAVIK